MPHTIAVAGKGGVGKTTTCGMLIDYLCKRKAGPVLVVDADANSNLGEVLGIPVETSLGEIREEIERSALDSDTPLPAGMTKQDYLNYRFNDALAEEDDFDLLVMGRTQGKGCYCFVNGLLQTQLSKISKNYEYIIVDNEAGMEHISRGILPHVDTLLLVSDCSRRGVQAAGRIRDLAEELKLNPGKTGLIVNRAPGGVLSEGTATEVERLQLPLVGVLPQDELIYEYDCDGKPIVSLPKDAPVRQAFADVIASLGL